MTGWTLLQCFAAGTGFGVATSIAFGLVNMLGQWLAPNGKCESCQSWTRALCEECRRCEEKEAAK